MKQASLMAQPTPAEFWNHAHLTLSMAQGFETFSEKAFDGEFSEEADFISEVHRASLLFHKRKQIRLQMTVLMNATLKTSSIYQLVLKKNLNRAETKRLLSNETTPFLGLIGFNDCGPSLFASKKKIRTNGGPLRTACKQVGKLVNLSDRTLFKYCTEGMNFRSEPFYPPFDGKPGTNAELTTHKFFIKLFSKLLGSSSRFAEETYLDAVKRLSEMPQDQAKGWSAFVSDNYPSEACQHGKGLKGTDLELQNESLKVVK